MFIFRNPGAKKENSSDSADKASPKETSTADEEELMKQLPMSFGTKQKANAAADAAVEARKKVRAQAFMHEANIIALRIRREGLTHYTVALALYIREKRKSRR